MPDAIALQYSVNRIEDIAENPRDQLTLFSHSVVTIRRKSILVGTCAYFIEASILPDTSTRCALAKAIWVGSTFSSVDPAGRLASRALLKTWLLPNPSSLDKPGDSALIFFIVM